MILGADIFLPRPEKIPFGEILGIPVPFSSTGFSASSHLPVMTSASFLQSGEWVGYYNCSRHLVRGRWDPPMKGIHFTADPDAGPHAWKASGIDNIAAFTLTGSIAPNGNVVMRERLPWLSLGLECLDDALWNCRHMGPREHSRWTGLAVEERLVLTVRLKPNRAG
jgi:hypothetical protein